MTRQKLVTVRLSAAQYARLAAAAAAASTSSSALYPGSCVRLPRRRGSPLPHPCATTPAGALVRTVSCRLTAAEAERLDEQARECEIPVAAYVRLVLRGHTPSVGRPVAHAAVVALSRVGNNLNQLTRLAHGGTLLSRDLFSAIEILRAEIHRLRERDPWRFGGPPMIAFKGGRISAGGKRSGLGSGFGGLVAYLKEGKAGSPSNPERVAWVSYRNLDGISDPTLAGRLMRAYAEENPRVERPVYHFGLSLSPGEHLTPEQWNAAVDRVLARMGLAEHQAVVMAHGDTDREHVHIVVNRVGRRRPGVGPEARHGQGV